MPIQHRTVHKHRDLLAPAAKHLQDKLAEGKTSTKSRDSIYADTAAVEKDS